MRRENIDDLLRPTVEDMGCELWGVDYQAGRKHGLLKVYIDRESGITVDDCERVSRQISALLDVEDPLPGAYTLEVSSPGLDRMLFEKQHYERYAGAKIKVRLRANFEGRRNYTGLLMGVEEEDVVLRVDDEEYVFPLESIERATVVPEFDTKSR